MIELRQYQTEAIELIKEKFKNGDKAVLLVMPGAGGKTIVASKMIFDSKEKGNPVLFKAHRRELIKQCRNKLEKFGISAGIILAGEKPNEFSLVQVASVQTLARREYPNAKLIIVDEAHRSVSPDYMKILNYYKANGSFIVGLTGTPFRTNKRERLGDIFDSFVDNIKSSELIKQGFISPAKVYGSGRISSQGMKSKGGDFREDELMKAFDTENVYMNLMANFEKYAHNKKTIVFCCSVKHSIKCTQEFLNKGYKAAHIDGNTPEKERDNIVEMFGNGQLQVLLNYGILSEGFDCLDEKTEILTPSGWKGIDSIKEEKKCYSLNKETGLIEIIPILKYHKRKVNENERMVTLNSQHYNIRVTEGHNFFVKNNKGDKWYKKTALELFNKELNRPTIPLSANLKGKRSVDLTDDEIRFISWVWSDGHLSKKGEVEIYQSEHKYHNEIRLMLHRLGFDFREKYKLKNKTGYENQKPFFRFFIPKGNGIKKRNGWQRLEKYLNKKEINRSLLNLSPSQIKVMWEVLIMANGSKRGNKSDWYWIPYKDQVEFLSHLASINGYAFSFAEEFTDNNKICYRFSMREKKSMNIDVNDKRSSQFKIEVPHKDEYVWCISNSNETIITRRNGKVAILGNCPDTECVILNLATKSKNKYFQACWRGSRISEGKTHYVVIDMADNCERFGFPDEDIEVSLEAEDKTESNGVAPVKLCPCCSYMNHASAKKCNDCSEEFKKTKKEVQEEEFIELQRENKERRWRKYTQKDLYKVKDEDLEAYAKVKKYDSRWVKFERERRASEKKIVKIKDSPWSGKQYYRECERLQALYYGKKPIDAALFAFEKEDKMYLVFRYVKKEEEVTVGE